MLVSLTYVKLLAPPLWWFYHTATQVWQPGCDGWACPTCLPVTSGNSPAVDAVESLLGISAVNDSPSGKSAGLVIGKELLSGFYGWHKPRGISLCSSQGRSDISSLACLNILLSIFFAISHLLSLISIQAASLSQSSISTFIMWK